MYNFFVFVTKSALLNKQESSELRFQNSLNNQENCWMIRNQHVLEKSAKLTHVWAVRLTFYLMEIFEL